MAEIDYAFLAEFAKVEPHGVLTVVGASWTFVEAAQFPMSYRMSVACRVRATIDEGPIPFSVMFRGPTVATMPITIGAEGLLEAGPNTHPYGPDNRLGHLFAMDMQVLLSEPGLYEVLIELPEHGDRRRLAFDAMRTGG